MNTQNLEYSEDVKAFPLVADAFSARDDIQVGILGIVEEMDKLKEKLVDMQTALNNDEALLATADDKLALVATMAQDQIDAIEKVHQECNEKIADLGHDRNEETRKVFAAIDGISSLAHGGHLEVENVRDLRLEIASIIGETIDGDSEEAEEGLDTMDLAHVAA